MCFVPPSKNVHVSFFYQELKQAKNNLTTLIWMVWLVLVIYITKTEK